MFITGWVPQILIDGDIEVKKWGLMLGFLLVFLMSSLGVCRPSNELILETYIAVNENNERQLLTGPVDVKFELITPTNNVVFKKSFSTTVVLGRLEITKLNDNDDFDPNLFSEYDLDARITLTEYNPDYSYNS